MHRALPRPLAAPRRAPLIAARLAILVGAMVMVSVDALAEPRRAAMVIDANTGAVLASSAADEPRYPASLTKMMTLYLTFDLIEKGRLAYADRIRISAAAANAPPSKIGLEAGDEISVLDAVKALVTKSANDIAVALAEHIAGSEANFARLMTRKARDIGMAATTFKNASGLPDGEQRTTARDMITLGLRLQDDFPTHYKHFATHSFTFRGKTYASHNTLMRSMRGSDGIKTGYTRASGFNLVSSVRQDGKHVVGVVLGGRTAASRNAEMRQLLTRALAKASTRKTRKPVLVAAPRPAKRPPPAVVAAAPAPAPRTAALEAAPASPEPQSRPTDTPPQVAAEPVIALAKVRPIGLAPRPRAATAPPTPPAVPGEALTTDEPAGRPADWQNPRLAFAGTAVPAPLPPPSAVPQGRPPSTLQDQMAALIRSSATTPAADGTPSPPTGLVAASTASEPAYRLKGPVAIEAAQPVGRSSEEDRSAGGFLIQVGAYASQEEAERQIAFVRAQAGAIIEGHSAGTQRIDKGSRAFYRARFAGFTSSHATSTCTELRRKAIDCFVTRAE